MTSVHNGLHPDVRWRCTPPSSTGTSVSANTTHWERPALPAPSTIYHRARLAQHLRGATGCLEALQACFPPATTEQMEAAENLEQEHTAQSKAQGWWATKAIHPARRVPGVALPAAGTAEAARMHADWRARLGEPDLTHLNFQGRQTTDVLPAAPQVRVFAEDQPAFVFQSPQGFQVGDGRYHATGLAREYARLHIKSLVAVHFYSGYRREGDLHECLQHAQLKPGLELFVISVDLCLQKQEGDLASERSRLFWLERIYQGQVCGAGGGPPCESWSAARYQANGPRPLRSEAHVYGLPSLTLREWRQTRVGTRLLHFLFEVVAALCPMGGFAFVEHPQYPTWIKQRGPPSIWSLPAVRALRTLHGVGITSFDQCSVGAVAK